MNAATTLRDYANRAEKALSAWDLGNKKDAREYASKPSYAFLVNYYSHYLEFEEAVKLANQLKRVDDGPILTEAERRNKPEHIKTYPIFENLSNMLD